MTPVENDHGLAIPVLEETARIEKRVVNSGQVSVSTRVHERDEVIETLLRNKSVEVERIRMDQPVQVVPGIREEGDMLIVPVVEEVLFVEKRLVLREEIRIRRTSTMQPTEQTVRLRREEATVTRSSPENSNT